MTREELRVVQRQLGVLGLMAGLGVGHSGLYGITEAVIWEITSRNAVTWM